MQTSDANASEYNKEWECVGTIQSNDTVVICEYKLGDLLPTYLAGAREQGVDLESSQRDETSMDAFDSRHLQPDLQALLPAHAHSKSGRAPNKETIFKFPPGEGAAWRKISTDPSHPSSTIKSSTIKKGGPAAPEKKKKKKKNRKFSGGGAYMQAAGGDKAAADKQRLRDKILSRRAECHQTSAYSIQQDGSHASTGWQGVQPDKKYRKEIIGRYKSGKIAHTLKHFYPVPAKRDAPACLFDSDRRLFLYRTAVFPWMETRAHEFYDAVKALLGDTLASAKIKKDHRDGVRGPHFPCIIGHHRQYCVDPILTAWHKQHAEQVEAFINEPIIQLITKTASSIVRLMFPGVAARFDKSAQWHIAQNPNNAPLFGAFWNLCINGLFLGQKRVHCLPHADFKNIVGVCVLVIYQIPGYKFNHSQRSWLVLWEAGVVVQLPIGTMVAYPSSLLFHFNVDICDFKFVTTKGDEWPTPENSTPIEEGDDEGRGSLVYFNQASMLRSSELDGVVQGEDTTTDYTAGIQEAFDRLGKFSSIID